MLDHKYRVRVNRGPGIRNKKNQPFLRQSSRRKKRIWLGLAGSVLLLIVVGGIIWIGFGNKEPQENIEAAEPTIELKIEQGLVQIKTPENEDFIDAADGQSLVAGQDVRTDADSLASLTLADGALVRLNNNSRLMVLTNTPEETVLDLIDGEVWVVSKGEGAGPQIVTSEARIDSGSQYNVLQETARTTITNLAGTVNITAVLVEEDNTTDRASTTLKKEELTTVRARNLPADESDFSVKDLKDSTKEEEWFQQNLDKDEQL